MGLFDGGIFGDDGGGWQGQLKDVIGAGVGIYQGIKEIGVARKMERQARKPKGGGLGMGFAMPGSYGGQGSRGLGVSDWRIGTQDSIWNQGMAELGLAGGNTGGAMAGCFKVGAAAAQRVTPCKSIRATGPDGQCYEWVYRGRPVLYSGDVAAAKRTSKLLGRYARKLGRRPR